MNALELADLVLPLIYEEMDENCDEPWAEAGMGRFCSERIMASLFVTDTKTGKRFVISVKEMGRSSEGST